MERNEGPYINHELLDRVMRVREEKYLHDDSWKYWERNVEVQEARHLSELCRQMQNFTQDDLAVATIVAMENYPMMVLQIVAEYILDKENSNGKHKTEN